MNEVWQGWVINFWIKLWHFLWVRKGGGLCAKVLALLPLLSLGLVLSSPSHAAPSKAERVSQQAAVAMPDQHSAAVAKQVLQAGGNAVDAAIAAGFVLAVTYPEAGNLGGGGFMTLVTPSIAPQPPVAASARSANLTSAYFLDYREKAPLAAHRDMYLDAENKVIPYQSLVGYKASGVPGTVMGFWRAHQRFATKTWAELLAPAIHLAEQGFKVSPQLAERSAWFQAWIADKSPVELNYADYFAGLTVGDRLTQPELAQTLKRIAKHGAEEFYAGKTAQLLVQQMQQPQKKQHHGLITMQDLAEYDAVWRKPVIAQWQGRKIVSAPPPSSGGIAIAQLLKMQAQLSDAYQNALQKAKQRGVPELAVKAHFYAEMAKRVYADRAHYLGDSDFVKVPIEALISDDYIAQRANAVQFNRISTTQKVQPGKMESPETTHFSIIDAEGNAVSNTYTLNMPFGNGVVVAGAGFLMNDEMDDFSTKPGVANVFGVVGGKANEIAPGKRMLSSMSPSIVMHNDKVEMVVGTPGGSTIITSVFQTIMNVIVDKMPAQQAVDAARVHHQLLPKDQIAYNPALPEAVKTELIRLGYNLKKNNYMGDVQLILRQENKLTAASDKRGEGVSKVFLVP